MDDLTLKQRKWLKLYLELGNATEAAFRVYDCKDRDSAHAIGSENIRKLAFADLLEEGGVTNAKLQEKIKEGLDATRVVSAKITSKNADEATDDFIEVPDYLVRHKYVETAVKIKGGMVERHDVTSGGIPINSILEVKVE
jgi:phage terminase small subunit